MLSIIGTVLLVLIGTAIVSLVLIAILFGFCGLATVLLILLKILAGAAILFGPLVLIGVFIGKLI